MHESGETAYYRRPEDNRAHRCEIISYANGCYTVKGMRTATCSRRPIVTVPADQVFPADQIGRNRKPARRIENHGAGLSVAAAESLHRMRKGTERIGMSEDEILKAGTIQSLMHVTVNALVIKNRFTRNSYDHDELKSEFLVAALQTIRNITANATDAELELFRQYLTGDYNVVCNSVLTIVRTGKTACIRLLKHRKEYHKRFVYIEDWGQDRIRRLAA